MRPQRPEHGRSVLTMLSAAPSNQADGIHQYTRRLSAALSERGDVRVECRDPRHDPVDQLCPPVRDDQPRPVAVLQYQPFNFARWGFAPWLVFKLWRLKRSPAAPKLALMAHEMYVPMTGWRWVLMGAWQRMQFFLLRLLSDVVFASISSWAAELEKHRPARPTHHLPVGSNLPDRRVDRAAERERLGLSDETIVLAAFGTGHFSRMMDYVAGAASAVAAGGVRTVLLNLGSGTPPVVTDPSVRVLTPGHVDEQALARYLAAADLYLAPFTDGVSTRRTTFMAALQHGLPVVGTDGHNTDEVLRRAHGAIHLTKVGDSGGFARAVHELAAADLQVRARCGVLARQLYEQNFDWRVISERLLGCLQDDAGDQAGNSRAPVWVPELIEQ